jgi:hypothetical protein
MVGARVGGRDRSLWCESQPVEEEGKAASSV